MVALQGWKSHYSIELATWGDRNTKSSNATERLERNGLTYLPILNASEWCPGIAQFYSIMFSLSRKKKDRTLSAWLSDSSPTDTTIKGSCLRTMQRSCSTDCVTACTCDELYMTSLWLCTIHIYFILPIHILYSRKFVYSHTVLRKLQAASWRERDFITDWISCSKATKRFNSVVSDTSGQTTWHTKPMRKLKYSL